MMKIGISTSVIQRGRTGIAQYLFALTRSFLRFAENHRFYLFVLEEDLPLFDFARGKMELVPVKEEYRPPVKNILWHQTTLPHLAGGLGLDVLHIPSYRRLLWPRPCALVATIHDLAPFHVSAKYDWKRMIYGRVIVKRLATRQHRIIAISQNTAADIRRFFGISEKRISVIHNGLEHHRFFPASRLEAKKLALTRFNLEKPFFLYVARLEHPAKNHVRLIEAFNRFKQETGSNWQLALGGSDWHGAEVIHGAIKSSPYASDIRALGFVADPDLPLLYRAADVFVYPSLYEGFGLPPIEAMACGTPVISSTRGSLGEVVGDAAAVIDPDDVAALTAALKKLALEPRERERLIQSGLKRAQLFNWDSTADSTFKVYQGVLS